MAKPANVTDCHVNIWEDKHLLPAFAEQTASARPGSVGLKADADTLYRAMATVDKAIIFSLRYGDSAGIDGDDEVTARAVRNVTSADAVVFTEQHSGTVRYYGGRMTLRFDLLDQAWLDRAVEWMTTHGHHPYFLLEEWEIPVFQQRFAPENALGALGFAPAIAYHAPGVPGSVYLFDPIRRDGATLRPAPPPSARPKCVEPAPEPLLN
jgi:hypothetical protein